MDVFTRTSARRRRRSVPLPATAGLMWKARTLPTERACLCITDTHAATSEDVNTVGETLALAMRDNAVFS